RGSCLTSPIPMREPRGRPAVSCASSRRWRAGSIARRPPSRRSGVLAHGPARRSLRLTAFLARRLERRAVLMVITTRIEEMGNAPMLGRVLDELSRERRLTEITLGPLGCAATADLVRGLVAHGIAEGDLDALGEQVWRISEGNP